MDALATPQLTGEEERESLVSQSSGMHSTHTSYQVERTGERGIRACQVDALATPPATGVEERES